MREAWFVHEQALIGSVLVLGRNNKHSQRWLKALTGWDFGEPIHRWLWSQLRKGELTADTARECREKFRVALVEVAAKCLKEELWWWGDWYVSEIKEEAVKRSVET